MSIPKAFSSLDGILSCICFATYDTLPPDEFVNYLKTGEIDQSRFTTAIPDKAQAFLDKNGERLMGYKNPPYWLKANFGKDLVLRDEIRMAGAQAVPMVPEVPKQTIEEYVKGLIGEDKNVVKLYTQLGYKINENLRAGQAMTKERWAWITKSQTYSTQGKSYVNDLSNILNNAPKYTGTTFRGMVFDTNYPKTWESFKENLKTGNIFSDKGFLSTSTNKSTREYFMDSSGAHKISIEIKSKSGVDISSLSREPKEKEILFNKNSKFIIKEAKHIETDKLGRETWSVFMEEL